MKKFKNRKNVKNVNNTVKNNANMDGFEELVKAAKEFKGALYDEVSNREYERKKLAETFEKTASNDAKAKEIKEIMEEATSVMWSIEDIINGKIDEEREKNKPFCLEREDFLTYKVEKSKKNKPASEVESLKAELENLKAHFKGVCAERDWHEQCLKSAENALAYKDKVIDKIKKKNAKRMAEKCEVISTLNEEIAYQYKRAERAESFIKQLDGACDLIKKHIKAYDSKKGHE